MKKIIKRIVIFILSMLAVAFVFNSDPMFVDLVVGTSLFVVGITIMLKIRKFLFDNAHDWINTLEYNMKVTKKLSFKKHDIFGDRL